MGHRVSAKECFKSIDFKRGYYQIILEEIDW
jgi:hypothetical protein